MMLFTFPEVKKNDYLYCVENCKIKVLKLEDSSLFEFSKDNVSLQINNNSTNINSL